MAKTKYRDEYANLARWMARAGLIDREIAAELGCSRSTLNNWKKAFPEFKEALALGKEHVDNLVEDALLKRALGFEYTEFKEERERGVIGTDQEGKPIVGMVLTKTVRTPKMVAPDVTAQIFWLKNRRPDKWRDRHDIDHSGGVEVTIKGLDW